MRFVLVRGGFLAAWCWSRTIPEIERLDHQAIAIDLPGHGRWVGEESTLDNRGEAVTTEPAGALDPS